MTNARYQTTGVYIDPLTDPGFKILFGRESAKEILIGFLNAVLNLEGEDKIIDVEYLDKEKTMECPEERTVFFDLHCETDKGQRFIVEMQKRSQPYFKKRTQYYVARAITEQGMPSEWDYNFMPVYGIFICQFPISKEDERVRLDVCLMDRDTKAVFTDDIRLIYLQLPYFTKDSPEKCVDDFEKWIYIIKNLGSMERMPFMERVFRRVENAARVENFSGNERRQYERDLKVYRDYTNQMRGARIEGRNEGWAEGMAEGRAEGKAEGKAEGMAEGKAEGMAEGKAEGRAEGIAEGIEKGIEKGIAIGEEAGILKERNATVHKLVTAGFTAENISSMLGMPLKDVKDILCGK